MKAVTGNRLDDGTVVYLTDEDQWSVHLCAAARFADDDALDVLVAAQGRVSEIADAYLIDVSEGGDPVGRTTLRETIRKAGPTVRRDLGHQARA